MAGDPPHMSICSASIGLTLHVEQDNLAGYDEAWNTPMRASERKGDVVDACECLEKRCR
jgi:hypothetical protein